VGGAFLMDERPLWMSCDNRLHDWHGRDADVDTGPKPDGLLYDW
jgi:hypothetical protein